MDYFIPLVIFGLMCGYLARSIAANKHRDVTGWMFGGFFFGIFAIIAVALLPPLKPVPFGMRPVRCPRCNAEQNVPEEDLFYDCWQCGLTTGA